MLIHSHPWDEQIPNKKPKVEVWKYESILQPSITHARPMPTLGNKITIFNQFKLAYQNINKLNLRLYISQYVYLYINPQFRNSNAQEKHMQAANW